MATVKDIMDIMQKIAPKEHYFREEYDNIGLIVGDENATVKRIMCCLDVTDDVLAEAIKTGADLIISHHPMIFDPVRCVDGSNPIGKKICKLINNLLEKTYNE